MDAEGRGGNVIVEVDGSGNQGVGFLSTMGLGESGQLLCRVLRKLEGYDLAKLASIIFCISRYFTQPQSFITSYFLCKSVIGSLGYQSDRDEENSDMC